MSDRHPLDEEALGAEAARESSDDSWTRWGAASEHLALHFSNCVPQHALEFPKTTLGVP